MNNKRVDSRGLRLGPGRWAGVLALGALDHLPADRDHRTGFDANLMFVEAG